MSNEDKRVQVQVRKKLEDVYIYIYTGVSNNNGTPKSSILIGFSIIFTIRFGVSLIFGNTHIYIYILK